MKPDGKNYINHPATNTTTAGLRDIRITRVGGNAVQEVQPEGKHA